MVDEPLEPCWKGPETLQGRMMVPAILVLVFYTLGYPIFVITLFHFKRKTIYDDQMLRARGMGRTFSSNPHYRFRMQFGRLYSHFRPSHFYWLLVVIMRKFVLCVAAVSYKENVMFQLAMLLLAIFIVLLIHVKANPFMDIQERAHLILDQATDLLSKEMSLMRHMQKLSASPAAMHQLETKIEDTQNQIKLQQAVLHDHNVLLWNLNTVETVMDAGMIMVLLSGITFDSPYVQRKQWVKSTITYGVILIIVSMWSYYFLCLMREFRSSFAKKRIAGRMRWSILSSKRLQALKVDGADGAAAAARIKAKRARLKGLAHQHQDVDVLAGIDRHQDVAIERAKKKLRSMKRSKMMAFGLARGSATAVVPTDSAHSKIPLGQPVSIDVLDIDDILNDSSMALDDLDSFLSGEISLDALHNHNESKSVRTRADMKRQKREEKRRKKEAKRKKKMEHREGGKTKGFLQSLEDRFHYHGVTNIRKQRRTARSVAATDAEVHL